MVAGDPGDQPRFTAACRGRRYPDYSRLSAFPAKSPRKATTFFEIAVVFFTVYGAAYPNERMSVLLHYLAYAVSAFVVISGFHYAVTVARRLHHSS